MGLLACRRRRGRGARSAGVFDHRHPRAHGDPGPRRGEGTLERKEPRFHGKRGARVPLGAAASSASTATSRLAMPSPTRRRRRSSACGMSSATPTPQERSPRAPSLCGHRGLRQMVCSTTSRRSISSISPRSITRGPARRAQRLRGGRAHPGPGHAEGVPRRLRACRLVPAARAGAVMGRRAGDHRPLQDPRREGAATPRHRRDQPSCSAPIGPTPPRSSRTPKRPRSRRSCGACSPRQPAPTAIGSRSRSPARRAMRGATPAHGGGGRRQGGLRRREEAVLVEARLHRQPRRLRRPGGPFRRTSTISARRWRADFASIRRSTAASRR